MSSMAPTQCILYRAKPAVVRGCQIWAASGPGKNKATHFCDRHTCAQAGVRPGIVVKEKDSFRVSVKTNSADALSEFKFPCAARDVLRSRAGGVCVCMCLQHCIRRLTQRWQKCVENDVTLWEKSVIFTKTVWITLVNFIVIAVTFSEKKLDASLSYRFSYVVPFHPWLVSWGYFITVRNSSLWDRHRCWGGLICSMRVRWRIGLIQFHCIFRPFCQWRRNISQWAVETNSANCFHVTEPTMKT
jgi:hypothetical protein